MVRTQTGITTLAYETPIKVYAAGDEQQLLCELPEGEVLSCSRESVARAWEYAQGVGYVYPQDLPGISSLPADLLISLLTQLDYLHPILMWRQDGPRQIGMQLIPPVSGSASSVEVA
jgi:hypothetical protein